MPSRPQVAPTEDWRQIELLARAPGQRTYELIRPAVLFGQSPAERAAETGAAEPGVAHPVQHAPEARRVEDAVQFLWGEQRPGQKGAQYTRTSCSPGCRHPRRCYAGVPVDPSEYARRTVLA